eukprot:scaffold2117_cov241-Pinguiococcus_pyrenoidosus.AAC.19
MEMPNHHEPCFLCSSFLRRSRSYTGDDVRVLDAPFPALADVHPARTGPLGTWPAVLYLRLFARLSKRKLCAGEVDGLRPIAADAGTACRRDSSQEHARSEAAAVALCDARLDAEHDEPLAPSLDASPTAFGACTVCDLATVFANGVDADLLVSAGKVAREDAAASGRTASCPRSRRKPSTTSSRAVPVCIFSASLAAIAASVLGPFLGDSAASGTRVCSCLPASSSA